jgi:hypothetical protein
MNPLNPTKNYVTTKKITRKLKYHREIHITTEEITYPVRKSHNHRGTHITHYYFALLLFLVTKCRLSVALLLSSHLLK